MALNGRAVRRGRASSGGSGSIETDYLNGEIVLLGRLHGVPTPVNALLQQLSAQWLASEASGTHEPDKIYRALLEMSAR